MFPVLPGDIITADDINALHALAAAAGAVITTKGDLIAGGASGVASRLAIGPEGATLQVIGGVPVWVLVKTGEPIIDSATSAILYDTATGDILLGS